MHKASLQSIFGKQCMFILADTWHLVAMLLASPQLSWAYYRHVLPRTRHLGAMLSAPLQRSCDI